MSCEGLMHGDAQAIIYFNVLATRVYKKQLRIQDGRGVLFAVADDVKLVGPQKITANMAEVFPTLAWEEADLTTKMVKSRIYVKSSWISHHGMRNRTSRNMTSRTEARGWTPLTLTSKGCGWTRIE
jgi:hypothetical protein